MVHIKKYYISKIKKHFFLGLWYCILNGKISFSNSLFGHEACGILAPQPGIEPAPLALEGEVLTTGSPEKFPPPPQLLFIEQQQL